ncbi:MAG: PilZ domain-containing protein [Candidatus Omnitrophica bacterium]|nr:PilZ domain-containing protein [Candidatus Omnitrophota bacterium]
MEERRQFIRVGATIALHYHVTQSLAAGTIPKLATNISAGGMRLPLAQQLEPGTQLALEMIVPGQAPIQARAEAIWSTRGDNGRLYEAGLRFIKADPSDQDRLLGFLGQSLKECSPL